MLYEIIMAVSLEPVAGRFAWFQPGLEILHYSGHLLLFGGIALFDLRLLGVARQIPVEPLSRITVRAAAFGVALALISGTALFLAGASWFWGNPMLVTKLVLIALALANVALFHWVTGRDIKTWSSGSMPPLSARLTGLLSLLLWGSVVACGRLIAYF